MPFVVGSLNGLIDGLITDVTVVGVIVAGTLPAVDGALIKVKVVSHVIKGLVVPVGVADSVSAFRETVGSHSIVIFLAVSVTDVGCDKEAVRLRRGFVSLSRTTSLLTGTVFGMVPG